MNTKKYYQQQYWLRKAVKYGIQTEGRENQAAREAEARYRKEYRHRKAERVMA
jgi:hypothetical protein